MHLSLKNDTRSTIVPNRFIECSVSAPDNYTKAYLIGLMYSASNKHIDLDLFCAQLNMSRDEVIEAYEYWQKKGVARIINSDKFCIEYGDFSAPEEDLYTEREFNIKLQEIFGSRQLSPHEYLKIYDYTDTFGLPKKVVLLLAQYCVLLKGKRVSIAYMDKVAKSWAEEECIDSEEKAQHKIDTFNTASSGISRVLKQLGISGRMPTRDEVDLFEKWTGLWGFTLEAILTACAHTTAAREPSMKYLDRILERLHGQGSITSRSISEMREQNDTAYKNMQELMRLLGEPILKPSFEHESLYMKWTNVYSYGMSMLAKAAKAAAGQSKKPFAALDSVLTDWYNNHITTFADADAYLSLRREEDKRIEAMFKAAGISRTITDAHRKAYAKWNGEWCLSRDVILLAAEISSLSENPYRYLGTIMQNWHNAGVRTLADAQRETSKYSTARISEKEGFERPTENYDYLAEDLFADEGAVN